MWKNYIKIAWRSLLKNKVFSVINILGLAIGMAACLVIFQYVSFEKSHDLFHENSDRIFRVDLTQYKNGELETSLATTFPVVGRTLKESFPESVETFARLMPQPGVFSVQRGEEKLVFEEKKVFYTDNAFFEVFTFPLVLGNSSDALVAPNSAVISETTAEKYFGEEWRSVNPVGKTIQCKTYFGTTDLQITGVAADPPENSHLNFDFLVSYPTMYNWDDGQTDYRDETENAWFWENFYTYILLKPEVDASQLAASFQPIVDLNTADRREQGFAYQMSFQPVPDIHLNSNLKNELEVNGNAQTVYSLSIVAICILVLAWVNFVNLSTVRSMERAKESGLRKTIGASRIQLILQHMMEAFLYNAFGLGLAIFLFYLSMPVFSTLIDIPFENSILVEPKVILGIVSIFIAGTLLSGLYPAVILSGYQPIAVLKGNLSSSEQGQWMKKGLVVFQFTVAAIFMMVVFTVNRQLSFMRNYDLGVDIDQKLVIEGARFANSIPEFQTKMTAYKASLKSFNTIENVTFSRNVPSTEIRGNNFVRRLDQPENAKFFHVMGVDYEYTSTFGMELAAGRFLDEDQPISGGEILKSNETAPDFGTKDHAILINETAAKRLGYEKPSDAIHQQIAVFGGVKEIVGVLKDYHHKSLKNDFEPIIFYLQPNYSEFITLNLSRAGEAPKNLEAVIDFAESEWKKIYPEEPFKYFFLDDFFNRQYKADQQFYMIFNFFTGLAIFIACLGLFGLSSYESVRRTKEIGIRKINGASEPQILNLLTKDFLKPVLLGFLIAVPIAWYFMEFWIRDFAFRISLEWWMFAVSGGAGLLIALLTVSFQSIKTARLNPVKNLRSE
ncbi:ABC transporter permease [Algoriphagus terrigena]|uniref:ABC transporter permease n=1 Tax=Algoriphagus terrigena TaxID=344884 RepID=UPI0004076E18|nr:ABC transporter permease [Algoriphagus terrigena]